MASAKFSSKPTLYSASTSTMICGHPWYQQPPSKLLSLPYARQAPPWTSMLPASSLAKPPLCLAGTSTVVRNNTGVQDTINRFGEATLRLVMQRHDRSFLLCQAYPYAWLVYPYAWLRHLDSGHCLSVQRHERSIVWLSLPYAWLLGTKPTLSLVIRHLDSGH
jgi:hypothetical protein